MTIILQNREDCEITKEGIACISNEIFVLLGKVNKICTEKKYIFSTVQNRKIEFRLARKIMETNEKFSRLRAPGCGYFNLRQTNRTRCICNSCSAAGTVFPSDLKYMSLVYHLNGVVRVRRDYAWINTLINSASFSFVWTSVEVNYVVYATIGGCYKLCDALSGRSTRIEGTTEKARYEKREINIIATEAM